MTFQRILQSLSFFLFALLLWQAAFPLVSILPVEMFLWLDPLTFLGTSLSGRLFNAFSWVSLLVLAFTFLLGRFYCGTLCPMGIAVDLAGCLISRKEKKPVAREFPAHLRQVKYRILLFILGAALLGVSLVYLASPISWITRLCGLILHPVLSFLGDLAIDAVRPLAAHWNMSSLAYAQLSTPRFDFQWITVLFFAVVFACARYSPRFWCRYLCPSGAILALMASKPLLKRQVSDECIHCGLCAKRCPMGAIGDDPSLTDHRECIVCETCVRTCPSHAVSFGMTRLGSIKSSGGFSLDRRKLLLSSASGVGAALVTLTSLRHIGAEGGVAKVSHLELIRPPGAVPEKDFLALCVGCGECMKACPTNTLQPVGLAAGISGFFSPVVTPHRGPCEPLCNVCGQVCPTGAIRPLPLEEKTWAKVGTAHLLRHKCLAWEYGKKCLICAEFCAYEALDFKMVSGISVAVPFVNEKKCSGCGVCEHNCPVQARSAIVVEPMGALRLAAGSYRENGREMGLSLSVRQKGAGDLPFIRDDAEEEGSGYQGLPPGFTD